MFAKQRFAPGDAIVPYAPKQRRLDASDPEEQAHRSETKKLIAELGLEHVPRLSVYNKADRLEPEAIEELGHQPDTLVVSALDFDSLRPLIRELERRFVPPASA